MTNNCARRLLGAVIAVFSLAETTYGANGTWTNLAGGSWNNAANWNGGIIAGGTGFTADFSTLTLAAAPTVTLDGAQTIGNLTLGDAGNTYGWTLNTGSSGPLTLAVSNGSPVITINNQTSTIGAVLAGTNGLVKAGFGTLVLTGTNTYSGATTITNGVMTYNGSGASTGSTGNLRVGGSGGWAVLNFNSSGPFNFATASGTTILVGGNATAGDTGMGAVNQIAGTATLGFLSGGNYLELGSDGSTTTAYGSYVLSGGALIVPNNNGMRIGSGGLGVFTQTGGSLYCGRWFAVGTSPSSAASSRGVATFTGGTAAINPSYRILLGDRQNSSGTLNLGTLAGGTASVTNLNTSGITLLNAANAASSVVNLNSGTLTLGGPIYRNGTTAGSVAAVNCNGGTLQAGAGNIDLITYSAMLPVNVFYGGLVVDTGTNTATMSANLQPVSGNGVYPYGGSFAITSNGGAGYLGAPLVTVTNTGLGSGASAIAYISSSGVVTNVTMTCPGKNYSAGDVLGFVFAGGGATSVASTFVHTLQADEVLPNVTGGLTKLGSGSLMLAGTNTFYGHTVVSNGLLYANGTLNNAGEVFVAAGGALGGRGSAGDVIVADGGGVEGGQNGLGNLKLNSLNFLASASVNVTPGSNSVPIVLTNNGSLTTGNEANSVVINLNGPSLAPGTYHLISYSGDIKGVGFGAFTLGSLPSGAYSLINNPGYVDLLVSAYPQITTQPVSVDAADGGTATFTVSAMSPGTLTYQWKFNGVDIVGATNATLFLSSVTAADQGAYTVLVYDGSNSALSAGAVLTVFSPTVTGQWDFKNGDLRATVGADLQYIGDATNQTAFLTMSINGQMTQVMAFGAYHTNQGLYAPHGIKPSGGEFVNQYSLLMDVMYPSGSSGQCRALFQTDPFNHPGNDAEFYVANNNAIGIPDGTFGGTLMPDTWYRIAFTVNLLAPAGQQLATYVNGVQVGLQSLPGGVDGRFALGPAADLFATGLSEGAFTQPGYVSSIQFVNYPMSAAAIAALGGPTAAKLPTGNAVFKVAITNSGSSLFQLGWGGPSGKFRVQSANSLKNPVWQNVGGLTAGYSVTVTNFQANGFYRVAGIYPDWQVGQLPNGEEVVPTKQIISSPGQQIQFSGRPVDMILSPDGTTAYIKNQTALLVVDVASWTILQSLTYPSSGGASMHGVAVSPDGSHVYVTGTANQLFDWTVAGDRTVTYYRTISLASSSTPCGIAISADGLTAYVCLSLKNALAVVDLASGTTIQTINVGVAPWDVKLSPSGNYAYVSDWGGRLPIAGDMTATSSGTAVVVDSRGIASSGAVSFVNLSTTQDTGRVATGLHPSALALSSDGSRLYVANANSDTVTVINTQNRTVSETISVRPHLTMPFGSEPSGLALSSNGANLFVCCGDNNAVAVVALPNGTQANSVVTGFIPTDWYPGAVVADSANIYVANVKGLGARYGQPQASWQIFSPLGTANKIAIPDAEALSKFTARVFENGRVPQIQQTKQAAEAGVAAVPVPVHVGEPSVFQHVLYIIKENKTYDQVFGDMTNGNGMASLCVYPQNVTPNHHALANQFVLLDNYYCNGVNSADGHCWSVEGNCSDQYEKSFGGFSRSYGMGTDPLVYSSSGFIWNNVINHGLTFRNFGEFYYSLNTGYAWLDYYQDYINGTHALGWPMTCGVTNLATYTSTNVPGSNLNIPDIVRAYGFIKELKQAEVTGVWPSMSILYFCCDHTGGTPSAQAQVADDDLALGQVVDAVSHSRFWTNTVIFVIEDDPQSGYDHVDGHRSLCLCVSPYTKRNQTVSTFLNQCGVMHTMEQILGIPPMNQQDAMSPLMFDCFTNTPDFTPYACLPNNIPLTTGVTGAMLDLSPKAKFYARLVKRMGDIVPDRIDDDVFNRYIWYSIKGDQPYPSKYVGAHGRGLGKLGLVLTGEKVDDDD